MNKKLLKILSLEDSYKDFELLSELLIDNLDSEISMLQVETREEFLQALETNTFDIILSDFKLPGFDAFGALEIAINKVPKIPFICVSGSIGEETAIELLKKGATDYVLKDRPDRLPFAITRAMEEVNVLNKKLQAEIELRESEQKFRDIFLKHSATKLILNPVDLSIVEANEAAVKFYGWSVDELKKMKLSDINISYTVKQLNEQISKAIKNLRFDYEVKHKKKDGSIVDVNVYASKLIIEQKPYLHLIIYNVTDKKLAEKQVKLLSRAVEQSSVSVMITNPEGAIEYVNPSFSKITGFSALEVIGSNPKILSSGFHTPEFYENLWQTILFGKDWTGEFQNKKKNGEPFWEKAVISPVHDSNNIISHFISIKEDITERKKMVEELIAAKEAAEQSDKLKTAFIHNISHEIRTPLNGILGFGEFLANNNLSEESKKEMLEIVDQSSNRLLNTITDYMDVALIVSENLSVYPKDFELGSFLAEVTGKAESLCFGNENLKLKTQFPPESDQLTIHSDVEIIKKIFLKLIDNAFKFTHQGEITLGLEIKPGFLEFSISDTGKGINSEKVELIFEMFNQEDASMTRGYEGSGLGLTIARGLVKLLGGEIFLSSEKGKGSVFSFTVPFEASQAIVKDETTTIIQKKSAKKPTLLIAEDDELNFMFMDAILRLDDFTKIHVRNGAEAVEACRQNPEISLVLMDIKMPVMNGMDATRAILEFRPDLPIIATTAYAQTGDEEHIKKSGCVDYISKPFEKKKLLELIKKYVG